MMFAFGALAGGCVDDVAVFGPTDTIDVGVDTADADTMPGDTAVGPEIDTAGEVSDTTDATNSDADIVGADLVEVDGNDVGVLD